jgi:hypothetical protein
MKHSYDHECGCLDCLELETRIAASLAKEKAKEKARRERLSKESYEPLAA